MAVKTNHVLGRGKLYFAKRVNGILEGERYIASTDAFSFDVSSDTLDKYSMEEGITSKTESALLKVERSGSFVTSSIDRENIEMFVLGDSEIAAFAGGAVSEEPIASATQNRSYQLGQSAANATGARSISGVVVKNLSPATTFILGADYEVDLVRGRISIVDGGNIASGTDIVVDYVEAAHTREQIKSRSDIKLDGAFRFLAYNAQGEDKDYYFPSVQVTANGTADLKGDDWQKLPFSLSILQLNLDTSAVYVDGQPM